MKTACSIISLALLSASCSSGDTSGPSGEDSYYRQEMRAFVTELSQWARQEEPGFIIIPQNGQELATENGDPDGPLSSAYLASLDATGREDMFYGYVADDQPTPSADSDHMRDLCLLFEENGIEVLATDYCWTPGHVMDSYETCEGLGFISFAADQRDLNSIPDYPEQPWNMNSSDVTSIPQAANFLYLINGENYATRQELLDAVKETSYDLVILDLFHNGEQFTQGDLDQIRNKYCGGERLLICYMSIGEAEDYRYYWNPDWSSSPPSWLGQENPEWPGNYKVEYWDQQWKDIIFGNGGSYLQLILDTGFDGVYLDLIDAYEYFEDR